MADSILFHEVFELRAGESIVSNEEFRQSVGGKRCSHLTGRLRRALLATSSGHRS